jgi:hypothetical protein
MIKTFEIYFHDLTDDAQVRLLEDYKTTESDENWDMFPIAVIDRQMDKNNLS